MTGGRARLLSVADTVGSAAIAAWVGGHAALGAYAARIVFRDLERPLAATTMTTIFRSFDTLIVVAMVALGVALVVRAVALGADVTRGANLVALVAALALLAAGVAAETWIHPAIERMFREGDTLSPAFAAMHKASSRLADLEVAAAIAWFGALAWRPARA